MIDYIKEQLLGYINVAQQLSKPQKIRVNQIVSYAINFTETHISKYATQEGDRSSQMVSNVWLNASEELMNFGHPELDRFARILREKSYYWSNPKGFDYSNRYAFDMLLTQVKAKLEELIK